MTSLSTVLVAVVATTAGIAGGCAVTTHEREIVTTRNIPVTREVREEVVVRPPMPAPRVEIRTIQPAATYRWVDGHYQWSGHAWEWAPGYWAP